MKKEQPQWIKEKNLVQMLEKIRIGQYTLEISDFGRETNNIIWFELLDKKGNRVALLRGERYSEVYRADYDINQNLPTITRTKLTDNLFSYAENYLRKKGVKIIQGRTHEAFANFLKKRGWKTNARYGTTFDMDADLTKPLKPPVRLKKETIKATPKSRAIRKINRRI